jgi:hypothetical protein
VAEREDLIRPLRLTPAILAYALRAIDRFATDVRFGILPSQ